MASTLSLDVLSKYKNNIFIETGTSLGDGVQLALDCGFKQIYSFEINLDLVEHNRKRFKEYGSRVEIIHGDSSEILSMFLFRIKESSTFWLDGHWDGGPVGKYRCPLLFELDAIADHPIKNHTLLIDDRRLFGDKNHHWGQEVTEPLVLERIKKINPDYCIKYENGHVPDDIITAKIL
jgi:hypothetical protein